MCIFLLFSPIFRFSHTSDTFFIASGIACCCQSRALELGNVGHKCALLDLFLLSLSWGLLGLSVSLLSIKMLLIHSLSIGKGSLMVVVVPIKVWLLPLMRTLRISSNHGLEGALLYFLFILSLLAFVNYFLPAITIEIKHSDARCHRNFLFVQCLLSILMNPGLFWHQLVFGIHYVYIIDRHFMVRLIFALGYLLRLLSELRFMSQLTIMFSDHWFHLIALSQGLERFNNLWKDLFVLHKLHIWTTSHTFVWLV